MGFQRETASRGALAMYTSVCLLRSRYCYGESALYTYILGRICYWVRIHRFPYDTYPALDSRVDYNPELSCLYLRTILCFISTELMLIPWQMTKKTAMPATPVGDRDREAR
jgi:hypothetical protein